jgi:crossover junction endodeoxyribonuclease RuvC
MRILGIDPGTLSVGYGVVDAGATAYRPVVYGVIQCRESDAIAVRLARIFAQLRQVIEEHAPDVVAIEDGYTGPNPRSAMKIGEGRGAAMVAASSASLPVHLYAPSVVKRAVTGTGRAGKAPVAEMVRLLLGLAATPPSDAADALGLAICHAQRAATTANGLQRSRC